MTGSALAILIAIVVVAAIAVGIAMFMMQRNRLRPLSDEARARYAQSWSAIESRFIEEPAAAVQEADQLVLAILHYQHTVENSVGQSMRNRNEMQRKEIAS